MEAIAVEKPVINGFSKAGDDSILNNNTSSSQICSNQLLETSIKDAIFKKETLASTMDLVKSLMIEVEYQEKAAEDAQKEAARKSLDILAKVDERKMLLLHAQEINNKLARKVNAEKGVLADKRVALEHRVTDVLDVGDRSLNILNEMCEALEKRLSLALKQKEFANEKLQENESVLAYLDTQMKEVVEEFNRLDQETLDNSKLQEFLDNRGNVVEMLDGEISDKLQNANMLTRGELEPSNSLSSEERKECKNVVSDIVDEGQTSSSEGVVASQSTIKRNLFEEKSSGVVNKQHGNQMIDTGKKKGVQRKLKRHVGADDGVDRFMSWITYGMFMFLLFFLAYDWMVNCQQ